LHTFNANAKYAHIVDFSRLYIRKTISKIFVRFSIRVLLFPWVENLSSRFELMQLTNIEKSFDRMAFECWLSRERFVRISIQFDIDVEHRKYRLNRNDLNIFHIESSVNCFHWVLISFDNNREIHFVEDSTEIFDKYQTFARNSEWFGSNDFLENKNQ